MEPTVRIGLSMPGFHVKVAIVSRLLKHNPTLIGLIRFNTVTEDFTETRSYYDRT